MTTINAAVSEVPCIRIPLQTAYVSPSSPETAIIMYSSNTDNQGNVELHLRDTTNEINEKAFTSVFGRLESDQDSYTISYQDDSGPVLHQNNIDILLGAAALQSNENSVNNFDIFETDTKESELILSPKSFVNGSENSGETNNNSQQIANEDTAVTEDVKSYPDGKSPSSGKKIKPKASSPNGWGPQQCSICSKVFGNTSALAKHKLTHSDERKYVCVTCGKAFKRQDHLNGHMLTHRHKKPFECKADGCGKSYCDARSLRRHTENHHLHPSLPIAPPTISVQEVISNTSNIPTCIHYAPKGTQSFQKSNNSTSKLPKTSASNEKSIILKTVSQPLSSSESGDDKTNATNATIIHCKNSRSNNNNDCLTQEQLHLIEHIVNEQRKKLKCEKGPKQLKLVTHQQSTGSDGAPDSRNVLVNSTLKITSTSVLVHNNKIKLLLQKGNIQTTNVNGTNNANKQVSKPTIDVKAIEQKPECKPVECNLCHRKFKNVPALNGHMRLHGGYFKKENDAKKWEKKESNGPQLTTASISVRALIEEKIIQKRSNSNLNNASKLNLNNAGSKAKILKTSEILSKPKSNTSTIKEEESTEDSMLNEYQPKVSSFAIPAAPSQTTTLSSLNTNELLGKNKEENENFGSIHEETLMFNELLLKRVHQKPVKRASSDPGTMSHNTQSPQLEMTFSPENSYLDVYHSQNGQYFTNSIGDDMFQNVQDTDSMLLHNVDGSNDLNNLQQIENSDFQEINLEEYENVTNDLQHQQDLQAVLNSPLPVSLAEFPYMQNETVITNHDQNTMPYSQSPLPSPGFTYPTPPASQEGQSPSFCHVSSVVHHTHVSSPLSSAFYSSGMSSPGAVEAALNEVLPMDVNQNVYPSPSSPSPLSVTPEPSPVSLSASTFNSQTDLYHSQSQDNEDSLLTANQKDFVFRNNGDDETYKFIDGDNMYHDSASQEYQNVILNCNRLIESGSQYVTSSSANSMSLDGECSSRNITLQTEGRENITLYADDGADTRCNITFPTGDSVDGEVHSKNARTISFSSSFDDSNNDINFNSTANDMNFQSENRNDISFYDKNLTFQMEDKDVAMYEGRENITLHSENQGHVVLHSDDRGNVIIQSDERNISFHGEENNNYEQHITFSPVSHVDSHNITLHIADDDYEQKLIFAPSIKENQETFVIKSSSNSRKRPLNAAFKSKFPQKSRLRVHRHSSQMLHYTPCPMLNPLRNSAGLYWQAAVNNNSSLQKEEIGKEVPKNQLLIESDEEPHINIGPHFQANIEPCRENPHPGKIVSHEDLVWEPAIKHGIMDNELDMYLEFACCAALPGGGRNKEYALHVLHLCKGNIHEAVLKLMQPKLHVPADHPLLTNDYCESEPWSSEEIGSFQQAIFKFDKNFPQIAQHVGTKTVKQCIQFYYLWKKACPEEYKRSRLNWRHIREMDLEKTSVIPVNSVNVTNEVEVATTNTDTRPFACEYPECLARFNSRAALNGHNRIHGGSVDRWRMVTPTPFSSGSSSTCSSENLEEFPCKLCGKVFSKIKSRSAHMKSHRPSEMEPKKAKIEKQEIQKIDTSDTNSNRQSSSPLF